MVRAGHTGSTRRRRAVLPGADAAAYSFPDRRQSSGWPMSATRRRAGGRTLRPGASERHDGASREWGGAPPFILRKPSVRSGILRTVRDTVGWTQGAAPGENGSILVWDRV